MSHSHIFFYERFFLNLFPFWRGGVVFLLSCRGCLHILHPNSLSDIQGFSPSDLLLHILESVLKSRRLNYLIKDNFFSFIIHNVSVLSKRSFTYRRIAPIFLLYFLLDGLQF